MKNITKTCLLFTATTLMVSCGIETKPLETKEYVTSMSYKENFKILQLSDLHLSSDGNIKEDLNFVDLSIKESKPDLIIITGDMFMFASKANILDTFSYFDNLGIKWAYTLGNHDYEGQYPEYFLIDTLESTKYTNLVNVKQKYDQLTGDTNTVINLVESNKTKFQLYIIDSNSYSYGSDVGYDVIHDDQIQWYKDEVDLATSLNDSTVVPSFAFFHIPLYEYTEAANLYKANDSSVSGTGEINEPPCPAHINNHFFDVMKEKQSTKAVFVGHDHINDAHIMYQGINLCYGVKSTNNIYHDDSIMGALEITINSPLEYSYRRLFHTYEEITK